LKERLFLYFKIPLILNLEDYNEVLFKFTSEEVYPTYSDTVILNKKSVKNMR